MSKLRIFKDRVLVKIKWDVEDFLNETKGIQILDISWVHADSYWHCIITYFEVE